MKIYFVGNNLFSEFEEATIQQCVEYVESKSVIGLDIETSRKYEKNKYDERQYIPGLDPYLSRIVMLQIGDEHRTYVIDVRTTNIQPLKPVLESTVLKVGQNLKFEARHLLLHGIAINNLYDTMLAEINLYNGLGLKVDLLSLSQRYLGAVNVQDINLFNYEENVSLDEEELEKTPKLKTPFQVEDTIYIDKSTRMQFINIGDKPFTATQIKYGAEDVILPLRIRKKQLQGRVLSDGSLYNPIKAHQLENNFIPVLAEIENNGLGIDGVKWIELAEKSEKLYRERVEKLSAYVVATFPKFSTITLFGSSDCTIKWTSPKQVIAFFKHLGICPKGKSKFTGKIEYTVGAVELLKTLPNEHKIKYEKDEWKDISTLDDLKLAYLLVNRSNKNVTTFGKTWLRYVHPITGRVHSNFTQIVHSGRLASSSPNIQQLDYAHRACFKPRGGNNYIVADYSAQEVRILADKSQDSVLRKFFTQGDEFFGSDFHSFTATKVYRILENDPELVVLPQHDPKFSEADESRRTNQKKATFGISYGKSAYGFATELGIEVEEAQEFIDSYYKSFPAIEQYFTKARAAAYWSGSVTIDSITGRKWFCSFYPRMLEAKEKYNSLLPENFYDLPKKMQFNILDKIRVTNPELDELRKTYRGLRGALERKGLNLPIQGAGGLILKASMIFLYRWKRIYAPDLQIVNLVHDEAVFEPPEGTDYSSVISKWMVQGGKIFCPTIPMVVEPTVGKSWNH